MHLRSASRLSDAELTTRVRRGDPGAFGALHDRYAVDLQAFAASLLGPRRHLAEDVVQDAFERAHRQLTDPRRRLVAGAWLYTVVRNRCLDVLRQPLPAALDDEPEGGDPGPLELVLHRAQLRQLIEHVDRLPARQRDALLLRAWHGLAHTAIAGELATSPAGAKSLVHRARERLAPLRDAV